MANKVYGKLKKFIKENYKFLIVYSIVFIMCIYPLPYYIYTGGGIINLDKRVSIEGEYLEKGSFNLAYVNEIRATLPTLGLSYILSWDRDSVNDYKINDTEKQKDIWQREKLYLQESIDNAVINAYRLANKELTIKKEVYKVLSIDEQADTNLKVGDAILKIDDSIINIYQDIETIIENKEVLDEVSILVLRDNKETECYAKIITLDNVKRLGIYLIKSYDYEVNPTIDLSFSNREGGSSGGFMLSLSIYNRLIEKDLTNGLKIVGTGTIDEYGNVGSIGGVKYKLMGAVKNKADLFLVPSGENYEEAIKEKEKNNYKIEIVEIKTLKDAVLYLESRV